MLFKPTAPSVVAVVVTCRPGLWFDQTLKSFAEQDYAPLSVLVIGVGDDANLAPRVAALLPEAHLASVAGGTGFAGAANKGVEMVDGVAHVLVCHDDVALAPDAVRLLLEEAYRSNAGLVCPKFVLWEPPDRLLSVGMGADRLGVTHPLVEPGELDQGQHDGVREVFVAPSGTVLVRTDLWRAMGGFDVAVSEPGEDLDLSWRAQLAGARVVVAPQALVRHLEASQNGLRPAAPAPTRSPGAIPADAPGAADGATSAARREQHRLRTLWTCYSVRGLVLVIPVVLAFTLGETVWALLHRRSLRDVVSPLRALVLSLARPRQLWAARRRAQSMRRASDLTLWKSQSRGSARLRALVRRRLEKGHEIAWAAAKAAAPGHTPHHQAPADVRPAGGDPAGCDRAPVVPGWRWIVGTAVAVIVLVLIGSRDVLSQDLPLVGQLPSVSGGVGSWWHAWWSGPGTGGLGGSSFAPPALLFMGLLGVPAFGSANLVLHVLVLGPLVLGPLGAYVETRRFGSQRGRLVATVLYAALPVPYDAFSQGHWAGLTGYAVAPWLVGGICALGGQAPYRALPFGAAWPRFLALGLALAIAGSFAPALLVLVPVLGVAYLVGSLLVCAGQGGARLLVASLVVAAVAFVALAPWSFSALRSWSALIGSPSGVVHPLGLSQVLRLQTGAYGGGALGWALVVAAAIPLFIGRSWRLAWAARLWMLALACMALTWAGSRGWFPVPPLELLLAPAGAALVFAVALGAASVEIDLSGYRFGWRQFAPAFGALAALAAMLPLVAWVGNGQWDLPTAGADASYAFPPGALGGDYRVLWMGNPGSLPLAAEGTSSGVSFAASFDGLPSVSQLWAPNAPGEASSVARDVTWAEDDETTALGHLLAPLAVRYVVVPVGAGIGGAAANRAVDALSRQVDLVQVGIDPSYRVFANSAWLPVFSLLASNLGGSHVAGAATPKAPWATAEQLQHVDLAPVGVLAVGSASTRSFSVTVGTRAMLLYGAVPGRSWYVSANGHDLVGDPVVGGATEWVLPAGTDSVVVSRAGSAGQHVADVVMLLIWAVAVIAVLSRLRTRLSSQLTMASLELGGPGAEVSEIDWPVILDGQNVG
jgi:GT2 family glycosyltransferase